MRATSPPAGLPGDPIVHGARMSRLVLLPRPRLWGELRAIPPARPRSTVRTPHVSTPRGARALTRRVVLGGECRAHTRRLAGANAVALDPFERARRGAKERGRPPVSPSQTTLGSTRRPSRRRSWSSRAAPVTASTGVTSASEPLRCWGSCCSAEGSWQPLTPGARAARVLASRRHGRDRPGRSPRCAPAGHRRSATAATVDRAAADVARRLVFPRALTPCACASLVRAVCKGSVRQGFDPAPSGVMTLLFRPR